MSKKQFGLKKSTVSLTEFASIALSVGLGIIFMSLSISEVSISYSTNIFNGIRF